MYFVSISRLFGSNTLPAQRGESSSSGRVSSFTRYKLHQSHEAVSPKTYKHRKRNLYIKNFIKSKGKRYFYNANTYTAISRPMNDWTSAFARWARALFFNCLRHSFRASLLDERLLGALWAVLIGQDCQLWNTNNAQDWSKLTVNGQQQSSSKKGVISLRKDSMRLMCLMLIYQINKSEK